MIKAFFNDERSLTWGIRKYLSSTSLDKADVYITWQDWKLYKPDYIKRAKKKNILSLVMQHGRRSTIDYLSKNKRFNELRADKICLWGESDLQRMKEAGYNDDRCVVTGCPYLENLKKRDRINKKTIVFFNPIHWTPVVKPGEDLFPDVEENFLIMKQLAEGKYPVVVKLMHHNNIKKYKKYTDNIVFSNPNERDHIAIVVELLKMCNVYVSIAEDTNALIAQAMDIPVIIVGDIWKQKPARYFPEKKDQKFIYSDAVYKTKLKNLNDMIEQVLQDDYKHQSRVDVAVQDGGFGMNVTKNIMDVIYGMVKK